MTEKISEVENQKVKNIAFHSLSPVIDSEKHKSYCDALEWALTNRKEKDIKNVALTGTYGSGKSSILKTFQETKKNGKFEFLNISLATFKEEENNDDDKYAHLRSEVLNSDKLSKNDQLRLIELSILQQIFYHEEPDKMPDSRFKKIKSLKPQKVKETTWLLFGVIFTVYTFFSFHSLRILMNLPEPKAWFGYTLQGLLSIGTLILCFLLLRHIIEFTQKLTISKLNFQNIEIQVAEKLDKSILNNHLDEILYFFGETKYNVVIIEDLDRFQQTEIFTKLREINLLINNSKAINREVVFVYAVRDEMFTDDDRVKFFDFIIPVIPVINFSNSNEQLATAIEKLGYQISSELINQVAYYIDDMRLLYNIVNEFHIYYQINTSDFLDKLFAVIVYKNKYPKDFVLLAKGQGLLFQFLTKKKKEWLDAKQKGIDRELLSYKVEIEKITNVFPKTLDQLKSIYLLEYINNFQSFSAFKIDNKKIPLSEMRKDDNFEKLIKLNNVEYYNQSNYPQSKKINFQEIENIIDELETYQKKKELIENRSSNDQENLREKIKELEKEKITIRGKKIKYLINQKEILLESKGKQEQLISMFLKEGYIAEDYLDYISYFYPGSISEKDYSFLMNVRNDDQMEFDYSLENIGNLVKKIGIFEFQKSVILNYDLIDHIIENNDLIERKEEVFSLIANESEISVSFFKGYIKNGKNIENFIYELSKKWSNIWGFISNHSSYNENEKIEYLKLILNYAEIEDLKIIADKSELQNDIEANSEFLNLIFDTEKLKQILKELKIKFQNIDLTGATENVKNFIYENNHYEINISMIELMIANFGNFSQEDFDKRNYSSILNSKCDALIEYIENYINTYVKNVFLELSENSIEEEDALIGLLNNDQVTLQYRKGIVKKVDTKIFDPNELISEEMVNFVLKESKVIPNWKNVLYYYKKANSEFEDNLNTFLNNENNFKELKEERLKPNENDELRKFIRNFVLNETISFDFYDQYLNSFPIKFKNLYFESLSYEKVKSLVIKNKLSFTIENYNRLREDFKPLHLTLIENNSTIFFDLIDEVSFNAEDMNSLLEYSDSSTVNKKKLIENVDKSIYIKDSETLTTLGKLIQEDSKFTSSKEIIFKVLLNSDLSLDSKIQIFNRESNLFDKEFIKEFLISLGGNFKELTEKGPMPSFKKTDSLEAFLNYLKSLEIVSNVFPDKNNKIRVSTFRENKT